MSALPTGTVAFLMTDVEGSAAHWEADAAAMAIAVEAHELAARNIIESLGGYLLLERGEGDSLFAVFDSASNAVRAAVELQIRLQEPCGPLRLRVRMAVHVGEAQARRTTYFGRAVNRTARIRSVAVGDQIIVSQPVFQIVNGHLPSEINMVHRGHHRLRDLLDGENLYEIVHPKLPKVEAVLRSLEVHPNNLPIQLTSFVGRKEVLSDTLRLIREHRLVTLVGAGGCGKTRLALQLGAEISESFEDGVWLVEAAPLRDAQSLLDAVTRVLQIDLSASGKVARHALFILDNCEHLRQECAHLVRSLIENVVGLHILTTSRESLGLKGERIVPIRPLQIPTHPIGIEELEQHEATLLFLERAIERDSSLEIKEPDAGAICEIVRVLDGIPLAIEQAASNMAFLGPRLLLERLDQWMAQPSEAADEMEPRHRTVESAIDWSFHLLSADEQSVFLRLSIFVGSCDLLAVEAVCSDEEIPHAQVIRHLQQLVGKSLVVSDPHPLAGARFRLLEPIRQFAVRRLPFDLSDLRKRHYEHFRAKAALVDQGVGGAAHTATLQEALLDIGNYRAALDFAPEFDPKGILDVAMNLRRFWMETDHLTEALQRIQEGIDAFPDSPLIARAYNALGGFAWQLGKFDRAESAYQMGMGHVDETADPRLKCQLQQNLGLLLEGQQRYDEALQLLEQSVESFRGLGLDRDCGHALASLANVSLDMCLPKQAHGYALQADGYLKKCGDRSVQLMALGLLAEAQLSLDPSQAYKTLSRCLRLAAEVNDPAISVLLKTAFAATERGRIVDAAFIFGAVQARWDDHFVSPRHSEGIRRLEESIDADQSQDSKRSLARGKRSRIESVHTFAATILAELDTI